MQYFLLKEWVKLKCFFHFLIRLENQLKEAEKDYHGRQKQLSKAYEELNKRITEHDKCMMTGYKTDITLEVLNCPFYLCWVSEISGRLMKAMCFSSSHLY